MTAIEVQPREIDAAPTAAAHAATPSATPACLSCGESLAGAFCRNCGQPRATGRLTLRAFTHEMAAQFLELDRGLLHTFVDLFRRPGPMIREYIAGRRRKYTSPVAFVVMSSALSLLRTALIPNERAYFDATLNHPDPRVAALFGPERYAMYTHLQTYVTTNKLVFDALMLIPIMLAVRFLFRKHAINVAEAGVFTAYTFGEATFLSVVLTLPFHLLGNEKAAATAFMLIGTTFLLYSGFGFFGRSFSTAWRLVAAMLFGLMVMAWAVALIPFLLIHGK